MKKLLLALAMLTITVASKAQFESGTKYFEGALNSIGATFNGNEELKFGAE